MDKCSFCDKSERHGVRLVRGPEAAICEECVALATEILETMPVPESSGARIQVRGFNEAEVPGSKAPPEK